MSLIDEFSRTEEFYEFSLLHQKDIGECVEVIKENPIAVFDIENFYFSEDELAWDFMKTYVYECLENLVNRGVYRSDMEIELWSE